MNKQTSHKVTPSEIEEFRDEVAFWLDRLELHEWDVVVTSEPLEGSYARMTAGHNTKKVTISICQTVEGEAALEGFSPKDSALHEVLELLLSPLQYELEPYLSPARCSELSHTVIHKLINALRFLQEESS